MRAIADDIIDVGFIQRPPRYLAGLTGFVISRHPYCVAIQKGHPLAASERSSPASLAKQQFIALTIEMEAVVWGNLAAVLPPHSAPQVV
jgi:hypothetical protein